MKKIFILCLMAFTLCSCAMTSYTTYTITGNVSLLSNDGKTIEQWDNATLADSQLGIYDTPYKNGGVEVTTNEGEHIYVNGGIIIVRNIKTNKTVHTIPSEPDEYTYDDDNSNYGG